MVASLKIPCWLLLVIGVVMTAYFAKDIRPSWLLALGAWMFVPYFMLFLSLRAAQSPAGRAVVLVAALGVVCYGFWVYFDRTFVHFSSIDFSPVEVPLEQSLVAAAGWQWCGDSLGEHNVRERPLNHCAQATPDCALLFIVAQVSGAPGAARWGRTHRMKTFLASAVSLILGLGLGWYFEHHRAEREKAEVVQQMVEGGETSDRLLAVMAARAIQMVESGQSQQAVQMLASPVAHYYSLYTGAGTTEERRAETRALIEQLAKTNQVVATKIAELSTDSQSKAP